MPTLVFDPQPGAIAELIAERERLGLDRRDEVWEGVLHMVPPPGHAHGLLATRLTRLLGPYADEAALELTGGVGIGSGETNYRVPDLAFHRPRAAEQWHPIEYRPAERSALLSLSPAQLAAGIDWPA